MLGILCDRAGIDSCVSVLCGLIGPALRRTEGAVFFALPQPGLGKGFVEGTVLTGGTACDDRVPIPDLVFNFALVKRKSDSKDLRALNDGNPSTYVVNPTNKLNQLMVMEMLQSCGTTCGLVAPHEEVRRESVSECFRGRESIVLMPESGANLNLVVHAGDIRAAELHLGRMGPRPIALELPVFSANGSRPIVLRIHLQRGGDGGWRLLQNARAIRKPGSQMTVGTPVGVAALSIADCVGRFIPRLGICFVDLVFDPDGNPFFLHLGGWDSKFFESTDELATASKDVPVDFWDWDLMGDRRFLYYRFAQNLLGYAALLGREVA